MTNEDASGKEEERSPRPILQFRHSAPRGDLDIARHSGHAVGKGGWRCKFMGCNKPSEIARQSDQVISRDGAYLRLQPERPWQQGLADEHLNSWRTSCWLPSAAL